MKQILKKRILLAFALLLCALLASCGSAAGGQSTGSSGSAEKNPSAGTNQNADAEITALSIGYLTESAYNGGNYSEDAITENADFASNALLYMVIDLNIKALSSADKERSLDVAVSLSDAFALTVTVQEAPTGKIESFTNEGGSLSYVLSYLLPANKGETKSGRMILKLIPNVGGKTEITVLVSGGNADTAVSGKTNASASLALFVSNLKFTLKNDGTYSVCWTGTPTLNEIEFPALYNGKPVTEIEAEAFADCWHLTGIVIPESVTEIGDSAFSGCENLMSVVIRKGVTRIGDRAFQGSNGFSNITYGGTQAQWQAIEFGSDCNDRTDS